MFHSTHAGVPTIHFLPRFFCFDIATFVQLKESKLVDVLKLKQIASWAALPYRDLRCVEIKVKTVRRSYCKK